MTTQRRGFVSPPAGTAFSSSARDAFRFFRAAAFVRSRTTARLRVFPMAGAARSFPSRPGRPRGFDLIAVVAGQLHPGRSRGRPPPDRSWARRPSIRRAGRSSSDPTRTVLSLFWRAKIVIPVTNSKTDPLSSVLSPNRGEDAVQQTRWCWSAPKGVEGGPTRCAHELAPVPNRAEVPKAPPGLCLRLVTPSTKRSRPLNWWNARVRQGKGQAPIQGGGKRHFF